jgi:hypothetical protein
MEIIPVAFADSVGLRRHQDIATTSEIIMNGTRNLEAIGSDLGFTLIAKLDHFSALVKNLTGLIDSETGPVQPVQRDEWPLVYVLNTFGNLQSYGHRCVKRWTSKVDIFSYKLGHGQHGPR